MAKKKRIIYVRKDKREGLGEQFIRLTSENYASMMDLDLAFELKGYILDIYDRYTNYKKLEGRSEFTLPLKHLLSVVKEVSYMFNSYIENPPAKDVYKHDHALVAFYHTIKVVQTLLDFIDAKLLQAKKVMADDRNFKCWEDMVSYCEALLADLACRGFKYEETFVDKWKKTHEFRKCDE